MEEFTFSPSQDRFILTIAINNDDTLEQTERFFARAELVSSDATGVMIIPDQSEITILDEDSKLIKNSRIPAYTWFHTGFFERGGGGGGGGGTMRESVNYKPFLLRVQTIHKQCLADCTEGPLI